MNGKETTQGSLLKYTAHEFRKMLLKEDGSKLSSTRSMQKTKSMNFAKRDSLAKHPCVDKYSSARYYELNEKDLWEVF